ncbi:MAG TPA: sulfatase [Opitutaceae bacterium]|nr:sulfatase [Opitutaceae bacterium]
MTLRLALLGLMLAATLAAASRPNFIIIIGDDISAADIGSFGNTGIRTPNIDRLAIGGRVFDQAYVTSSSCSPSRCSLLTSRYPHNLETAAELHGALPAGLPLLPQLLREAGYYTVQSGKAHFGETPGRVTGPALAAFDVVGDGELDENAGGKSGANRWADRLRERPRDRPFFMWFAAHDAHRVWDAESFTGKAQPADVRVPPELVDTPETRKDLAHYYDEIMRLDHYVGEVMTELARQEAWEDTVVVFLTDNGRPFPRAKTRLYDDGIKTPLIIHAPKVIFQPGRTSALASTIDLTPTLLEIAGVARPPTFQGVSLLPVLHDPAATVRDYIFAEQNWHNFAAHVRMVREGAFVYMRNAWPERPLPGASDTYYTPSADDLKARRDTNQLNTLQKDVFLAPRPTEELYDLSSDPIQKVNLARVTQPPEALSRLRAVLDRWTKETGDTVPTQPTADNIDLETGKRSPLRRGDPPGAATQAAQIHAPGPVRAH